MQEGDLEAHTTVYSSLYIMSKQERPDAEQSQCPIWIYGIEQGSKGPFGLKLRENR